MQVSTLTYTFSVIRMISPVILNGERKRDSSFFYKSRNRSALNSILPPGGNV